MQSETSLLSSSWLPDHGDERPSTNRGVEATHIVGRHIGKSLVWLLWVALAAAVLVMAICDSVVWFYPLHLEPLVTQIERGRRTMTVFSFFFFPRLADVHSRAVSGMLALIMFLIGSILASAGNSVSTYAAGIIFHTVGSSGLSTLPFLFVSDYTLLQWRGMALAAIYCAPLITVWASPPISERLDLKWAFGMFGILMFVICTPALVALHLVASRHSGDTSRQCGLLISKLTNGFVRMDPIGLLIFTIGFGLVDYNTYVWWDAETREQAGKVAMLVIGFILVVPVFTLWEVCVAPFPLMPRWTFKKRGVWLAVITSFCCRAAVMLPMRSFLYYRHGEWSPKVDSYYFVASLMGRAVFAPIFGCLFLLTRRYKPYLLLGGIMLILSCGLGLHSVRNAYLPDILPSTALLFTIQISEGVGEVAIDLGTMIGSLASVPHNDLATVVGVVNAIPIFASVLSPASVAISRRVRDSGDGIFSLLFSLATGLAIITLILSSFMPNYLLGDTHDATDQYKGHSSENATFDSEATRPSVEKA